MIIVFLTLIVIADKYISYRRELKRDELIGELTSKLMARDFTEYAEQTQPPKVYEPVEQTDESQYWAEVESNKV